MMRSAATVFLIVGLAGCGSVNDDGSVATGPLGQEPLMNAEVQAATRQALDACIGAVSYGASLSDLQAQGFEPRRSGYRKLIDKPGLMLADSTVTAQMERRGGCTVSVTPTFPVEVQTMQSLVRQSLAGRSDALDVTLGRSNDSLFVTIR